MGIGLDVGVGVSEGTIEVEVEMSDVSVGLEEVNPGVSVEDVGACINTAPTMSKFTILAAVRIAPIIRRIVSRKQIFLFFSMGYPYSSVLGHCSPGQN